MCLSAKYFLFRLLQDVPPCAVGGQGGASAQSGDIQGRYLETLYRMWQSLYLILQQRQILRGVRQGRPAEAKGSTRPETEVGSRKVGGKKASDYKAFRSSNLIPLYVYTLTPEN